MTTAPDVNFAERVTALLDTRARWAPTVRAMPPGSTAAVEWGCTCSPTANNQGAGHFFIRDRPLYLISGRCRLHCPPHVRRGSP